MAAALARWGLIDANTQTVPTQAMPPKPPRLQATLNPTKFPTHTPPAHTPPFPTRGVVAVDVHRCVYGSSQVLLGVVLQRVDHVNREGAARHLSVQEETDTSGQRWRSQKGGGRRPGTSCVLPSSISGRQHKLRHK